MARKPLKDIDLNKFLGWLKYIDQISLYFPHIVVAVLGILIIFSIGA